MVRMPCCNVSAGFEFLADSENFNFKSTVQELPLWDMQVEISCLGYQLAEKFQSDSLIPGVLLVETGQICGDDFAAAFFRIYQPSSRNRRI